ncbi:hypothetical protein AGMMS49525_03360 [Bacteroidia bacterium]|nr:hypothetical protein AGMMS49525_03360 [Bacteroidia bacterium]
MKTQKQSQNMPEEKVENVKKPFGWAKLTLKLLLLLAIVVTVVVYTDKKEYFVGDQSNNHVERKWRSFYRFADEQHKNADIVIFGSSHASAGVEPFIVSMTTNTYCFILNSLGSSVIDAYFSLKEVLKHGNKPKIVILETNFIQGEERGIEWGRIQSFEAKQGVWTKLQMLPYWLPSDAWLKAWSPTIRNHSFLLTNPEQIEYNKNTKDKNPDRMPLDLGRFSHGNDYMSAKTIALFDSCSPNQLTKMEIPKSNHYYLKKVADLCQANGIELMFLTVPMWHKTFSHYDEIQKSMEDEIYKKFPQAKVLDLQLPYDTLLFTSNAFNDEYSSWQHTSGYGMQIIAYKLSDFLLKNYASILPDRSKDPRWIADLEDHFSFVYNQDVPPTSVKYRSILKDKAVGSERIIELAEQHNEDHKSLILKIAKPSALAPTFTLVCLAQYENQRVAVPIPVQSYMDVFPPRHNLYFANIRSDVQILDVITIE